MWNYYIFLFSQTLNFANAGVDDSYFALLKLYLQYFLPKKPLENQFNDAKTFDLSTPIRTPLGHLNRHTPTIFSSTPSSPSPLNLNLKSNSNCDIFNTGLMIRAMQISNFFINCFIENWLSQHDRMDIRNNKQGAPLLTYNKPNNSQLKGISIIIDHLHSLNISKVTAESQVQRLRTAELKRQAEDQYEICKGNFYRSLRPKLYTFLRIAFENWPRDDTFGEIINIWINYLTPWKSDNSNGFTDDWYISYLIYKGSICSREFSFLY
jgi:hypothetical protein